MTNQTCPHCGAEIRTAGALKNEYYLCWTNVKRPSDRDEDCYERQIEQLKQALIGSRQAVQTWAYYPEVK